MLEHFVQHAKLTQPTEKQISLLALSMENKKQQAAQFCKADKSHTEDASILA